MNLGWGIDLGLYLLSDQKIQRLIRDSKDVPDLLGRLIPHMMRSYFRFDLKKLDQYVKESRNFRELAVRFMGDFQDQASDKGEGKSGADETGRVVQFITDVPSESSKVS